jgi:hypothetical protein
MYTLAQFQAVRKEMRFLRQRTATLERAHFSQKQRADKLEEENHRLRKENERLKKEEAELLEKLRETEKQRDTYKGMVFKADKQYGSGLTNQPSEKRDRGGQSGHPGFGRAKPVVIDRLVRVYLLRCPDCGRFLSRTNSIDTHTITDIPHYQDVKPISTEYAVERQWCGNCQKEVHGQPYGVVPGSRLGLNLILSILVFKYRCRMTLTQIANHLQTYYAIHVSEGALLEILFRTKEWFGPKYDEILTEIRGSPVKHGDETGYRVNGQNFWCWTGVAKKSSYYTIEESRGGGVADEIFMFSGGVLVRDDYGGYMHLQLPQQSCWAHLLRKSHEATLSPDASPEVKQLHQQLKQLFLLLSEDVKKPFNKEERQKLYQWYRKDMEKIMATNYQSHDAQKIQTRIKNQNTNLLTALLYPDVPLTNNPAELSIKQVVGLRKISGGSKTHRGARIHAVNLSVIETIRKQKLPLLDTLQEYILQGLTGKN